MRKLLFAIAVAAGAAGLITSCSDSDDKTMWESYETWRKTNVAWFNELSTKKDANGQNVFTTVAPPYSPNNKFLMRFIGERHPENLKPLFTSTAMVNYELHLCNDSLMDKGTGFKFSLASGVITGWSMAVQEMHVGDSAEVILPYWLAYGESGYGSIPPYSYLRFNIKLTDIPAYEVRP